MSFPSPAEVEATKQRSGPSAADIASRVAGADPRAQANADAHLRSRQMKVKAEKTADLTTEPLAPPRPIKVSGVAVVKGVLSGDTLILMGSCPPNQLPPEKTLVLDSIIAPKMSRRKDVQDEDWAWASREFLRKRVIGQQVQFEVTYIPEGSGREYGTVVFEGRDLATMMVDAGWATVKMPANGKVPENRLHLVEAENKAKEAKRGVHQKPNRQRSMRSVKYIQGDDAITAMEDLKGKKLRAIVDHVREGSVLRCEVLGTKSNDLNHRMITLHLAGAQSPRIPPRGKDGSAIEPEPFALQSQLFTSSRLLHREVTICVLGMDRMNNYFGAVTLPQGNIAVLLLRHGMARVVNWTAAWIDNKEQCVDAENQAKAERLGVWQMWSPSPNAADQSTGDEFAAKVIQVVSSDTVCVLDSQNQEHRLVLSSIRAPRLANRNRGDEPWAIEGKDFLRKRLIGRKVKVVIDYTRKFGDESRDAVERRFVSLFVGSENIAVSLLSSGLARVLRHRVEEDRSSDYQNLLAAEEQAIAAKRGIHSGTNPPKKEIHDLTERVRVTKGGSSAQVEEQLKRQREVSVKAKQFLPFLQKKRRVKGMVEHVISGTRFKVFVPQENCMIILVIGGVKCPSTREPVEPYALEAANFAKSKVLQLDVEVEIETLDKGDNFIGSLFIHKKNLAVLLLERGLGQIIGYSANRSPYAAELFAAERHAKEARLRLWKDWTPEQDLPPAPVETAPKKEDDENKQSRFTGVVVEAMSPEKFFLQKHEDPNLARVRDGLQKVAAEDQSYDPSKGELCATQYEDGIWYRCKIVGYEGDDYQVQFLDYGTLTTVSWAQLRPLPLGLESVPPLALHACLAGCSIMREYEVDATEAFGELVWNKEVDVVVETVDRSTGLSHVILSTPDMEASVNEMLLQEGLVRVPSRLLRSLKNVQGSLKKAEAVAKKAHLNIWEYGDVSSDEEEGVEASKR